MAENANILNNNQKHQNKKFNDRKKFQDSRTNFSYIIILSS